VVPEGKYFVLGDNRDRSLDGRYWGFVPREAIVGRPVLLYFSLAQHSDQGADPAADEGEDEDTGAVATTAADDKLGLLRARFSRLLGEPRWRRILRVAP
jgi:signal peptidase I